MASVSDLTSGTHSARWGRWVTTVFEREGSWSVKLWRWPVTSRAIGAEIGAAMGFTSAREAVRWACERMHADGAVLLVLDAPRFRFEDALDFLPAPVLAGP